MPKIKICAVQFRVDKEFSVNIRRIEKFFMDASKMDCDIICFPEVFLTGSLYRKKYDPKIPVISKKLFSRLSENYGLFVVMGSIIEKIKNDFFNVSYLFDDNGNIIGNYKKNHLVQKSEAKYLRAGNEVFVFKTRIGNIGIQICRDLLYPEITRKLMLKNAEIVFCPSFWCSKSSQYDWIYNHKYFRNKNPREVDALVSARAIESECIFVYANAAGTFNHDNRENVLLGRTQIAMPFYGTTDILSHSREDTLIKEIDLSIVKDSKIVYKIERNLKDYYTK